jgi:Insertion element 4 transposase N-terminal
MYSLRQIDLNDKISEQVSIGVFAQIYPTNVMHPLVEQSPDVQKKERRVRHFVPESVIWFVLMMALWTRLSQARVWDKLTHKLVELHPNEDLVRAKASALS